MSDDRSSDLTLHDAAGEPVPEVAAVPVAGVATSRSPVDAAPSTPARGLERASGPPGGTEDQARMRLQQRREDELRNEARHHDAGIAATVALVASAAIAEAIRGERHEHHASTADYAQVVDRQREGDREAAPSSDAAPVNDFAPVDTFQSDVVSGELQETEATIAAFDKEADDLELGDLVDPDVCTLDDPKGGANGGHDPSRKDEPAGPAEIGAQHPDARPWNGHTSVGTISSVDGDRVEQYVGRGEWTSFSVANDLHGAVPQVGQSVQINSNGSIGQTPEQQMSREPELGLGRELG